VPGRVDAGRWSWPTAPLLGISRRFARDSIPVNDFIWYDPGKRTVAILVIAALNSAQGGFNFNGGSNGNQTITVPVGWTVNVDVENHDAIPHSAIVIRDETPMPVSPDVPALPRAFTNDLASGLTPQTGHDTMNFQATAAGNYLIACGVPGHATSGMYIRFVVSPDARAPSNTGGIGKKP
jgi:sulfocyanin